MRFPPSPIRPLKTVWRTGVLTVHCLIGLSLVASPASAELVTGRDAKGTLWISDHALPGDIKSMTVGAPEVTSLPAPQTNALRSEVPRVQDATKVTPNDGGQTPSNHKAKDRATCDGIDRRYAGAHANLLNVEQKKANGQLLIPDSGLTAMRQNLATLERLRALCE